MVVVVVAAAATAAGMPVAHTEQVAALERPANLATTTAAAKSSSPNDLMEGYGEK